MNIRILPYAADAEQAAQDFNGRLRAGGEFEFQVPNHLPPESPAGAAIRNANFLALEGDVVRGGFLLATFPASFAAGELVDVINCREPLSEGIVDTKYSLMGLRLLKHIQQQGPFIFALGMGSEQARFPRILKSAGWTVEPVPFLFRVVRVNPFLRELRQLQAGKMRLAARVAALTGAGKLGVSVLQAKGIAAASKARAFRIERVSEWGEWADALWEKFRPECSFCVRRDRATLRELYRLGLDRSKAFVVKRGQEVVGWVAAQSSRLTQHKYFGNMHVATVLDNVAIPEARESVLALACRQLASEGADLIVSNQSYKPWIEAFRGAGFLTTRSNYILATSKGLDARIAQQPGGRDRLHFTRGDGDGRDHL